MLLTHWWRDFIVSVIVAICISVVLGVMVTNARKIDPVDATWKTLEALPRTDAVQTRQDLIATQVRAALYDEVPAFTWTLLVPPTFSSCPGAQGLIGGGNASRIVDSGTWSAGAIPVKHWPAAIRDLQRALTKNDFTAVDVLYSGKDEQQVSVSDASGSTIAFALSRSGTTFSLESDCRLLPGARKTRY